MRIKSNSEQANKQAKQELLPGPRCYDANPALGLIAVSISQSKSGLFWLQTQHSVHSNKFYSLSLSKAFSFVGLSD